MYVFCLSCPSATFEWMASCKAPILWVLFSLRSSLWSVSRDGKLIWTAVPFGPRALIGSNFVIWDWFVQCSENFNSDLHSRLQSPWFLLVTWPPSLRYKRNWVALGTRRSNHYNLVPGGCDPFAQHQITNLWKNPKNKYLWLADKNVFITCKLLCS